MMGIYLFHQIIYIAFRYALLNQESLNNTNKIITNIDNIIRSSDNTIRDDSIHHTQLTKRSDGRNNDEIRPLSSQVTVLPAVHGSSFFKRGDTHVSEEDY